MKKLLLVFMLIMSVSVFQAVESSAAPKQNAVEAYSDTTSASADNTLAVDTQSSANHSMNFDDFSYNPNRDGTLFDYLAGFFGTGGVIVLAILAVVFGLLFIFAPLILIFLLVRYLYRRHQDRVKLMEMAMDKGVDIPESARPIDKQSDEYLVKCGLKNAFLGLGFCAMFLIWGANFLAGIGALFFFYGVGQTVIGALPNLKKWWGSKQQ